MKTIKITDKMAHALIGSVSVGDHRELAHTVGPATKRGLARRRLVVPGQPWRLTDSGEDLRRSLIPALAQLAEDRGMSRIPAAWKAVDPATTTLGKPVTDFQVKVWYASGSSEVISHVDFMAAAGIYSEATDNARVIAAEVHCPGGCLAASFKREGKCPDPAMCERMGDKDGRCWACRPADHLDTAGERG